MTFINQVNFFLRETATFLPVFAWISMQQKSVVRWLLYPSLICIFLVFDFFKCNIYATVAYMLHFAFLYHFFALIKRYSNSKYRRSKIYNISYKIVGFALFITIEICKANYFTQALLKTPLSALLFDTSYFI